ISLRVAETACISASRPAMAGCSRADDPAVRRFHPRFSYPSGVLPFPLPPSPYFLITTHFRALTWCIRATLRSLPVTDHFIVSRRKLLQSTGALLATAAFRPQFAGEVAEAAAVSDVMTTLSTFMAGAATRMLPEPVVEKTKFMILETLAAMISG